MSTYLRRAKLLTAAFVLALAVAFGLAITSQAFADEGGDAAAAPTAESVAKEIEGLSTNPMDFKAEDREKIEAIQKNFDALSAEDQATLEKVQESGQPPARVLESALWSVKSYDVDNSTVLADGTYTATSDPAVTATSDKGKSTSSRTRNWYIEKLDVKDGKAIAHVYVTEGEATAAKLDSMPSLWAGGKTYAIESDNTYAIPVNVNGVTYFAGVSSTMPAPTMYELTTTIDEEKGQTPTTDDTVAPAKAKKGTLALSATAAKKAVNVKAGKSLAAKKYVKVTKKTGKLSYKIAKAPSKIKKAVKVNSANGKITFAKKCKKGTYTIQVKITSAATAKYTAVTKTIKVKVKVK